MLIRVTGDSQERDRPWNGQNAVRVNNCPSRGDRQAVGTGVEVVAANYWVNNGAWAETGELRWIIYYTGFAIH